MQFSLLVPPTDAPNRMPLSRGLPSASAMAVDTGGLPRSLPMPEVRPPPPINFAEMNVEAVALPYQALARLAVAGGNITSDMATLVIAAEAKKREANETVDIDKLYTDFTREVDEDFAQMKMSETDETLVLAFNTMWASHTTKYKEQTSNPRVQAGFTAKANTLLRAKSGEVTTTRTQKFIARQTAAFEQSIATLADLATNPSLTPAEQQVHQAFMESRFLQAAHQGLFKADDLAKKRTEVLDGITLERAHTKAFLDPMGYLEEAGQGNTFDLPSKHQRSMITAATNQLKVERAEREHAANLASKLRKEQQDAATLTLRQQITENWGPEGPRTSMIGVINAQARHVGDDNYKSLLETERIYQALATKPGPKPQSDVAVVGNLQAKLTTDRWREITQDDLLRLLKSGALDDQDHRYFSNKLDALVEAAKRPTPETDAEKARKDKVKDAEKTIEAFIERGSKYESAPTQTLARDAITELHRQVAANPDLEPDDIATQLIAKKIAGYREILDGLPYKTKEEVQERYDAKLMTRREAERYFAIFDLVEKHTPAKKTTTPAPAPSMWQRFNPFGGGTPEGEVRKPVPKRKSP